MVVKTLREPSQPVYDLPAGWRKQPRPTIEKLYREFLMVEPLQPPRMTKKDLVDQIELVHEAKLRKQNTNIIGARQLLWASVGG